MKKLSLELSDQIVSVDDGEEKVNIYIQYNIPKEEECYILFLHGWLANSNHWFEQLEELGRIQPDFYEKTRIVLMELRGHGRSYKPQKPEDYEHKKFSGDILAVLKALEIEKVVLWGYSLGSKESFHFLVNHPDRVKGLILGGFSPNGRSKLTGLEFLKNLVSEPNKMENHLLQNGLGLWSESEINNFYNQKAMTAFVDSLIKYIGSNEISKNVFSMIYEYNIPCFIYTGEKDTIYTDFIRLSKEWKEKAATTSFPKKDLVDFYVLEGNFDHLMTWKKSGLYINTISDFLVKKIFKKK